MTCRGPPIASRKLSIHPISKGEPCTRSMPGRRDFMRRWFCRSSTRFESNKSTPRRAKEQMMSTIDEKPIVNTADVTPTETFPFEADARAKISILRAMAADFSQPTPRSLTAAERRLVSSTPREFVEKSVNFGQTAPSISTASNADFVDMRESEAYTSAYNALIDEIESLRQTVRKAVALRRLNTVRAARSTYRMGQIYVRSEGGQRQD